MKKTNEKGKSAMKNMIANYHTHTYRCSHASGEDREYIQNAVTMGLKTLGFSDHSPMIFHSDYYSEFRIKLKDTENYFSSISSLKEEFKDKIKILAGVEAEYYPGCFRDFLDYISAYPLDYMILGQHFIWEEENGIRSFKQTDDPKTLEEYYKNVLEAAQTGKFLYIAHPDVINYTGNADAYNKLTKEFLREIKKYDIPLEINRLGFYEKRQYPREAFWELCGEEGIKAVIGLDAHSPQVILDEETVDGCIAFAEKHGVEIIRELDFGKYRPDFR
ncbi:MAG: histidinol-phosphatase [Oscillospiraceae bacterium]|nr:histidinol-phosphatase [Oscillospiraceae bacterium]